MEAGRHLADMVAMAHPHGQLAAEPFEEAVRLAHREQRRAVLARGAGVDLAAEVVGDQLHAVADAEHGDA